MRPKPASITPRRYTSAMLPLIERLFHRVDGHWWDHGKGRVLMDSLILLGLMLLIGSFVVANYDGHWTPLNLLGL